MGMIRPMHEDAAPVAGGLEVVADVLCAPTWIVNTFMIGRRRDTRGWVLIDAGMPLAGGKLIDAARQRFGPTPPRAIILTHGHFDHVGAIEALLAKWNVPVYAHELELPYLTGRSKYPPPDPTVGGGMMARMSMLYPRGPIDLRGRVRPLPPDGVVPELPEWRWIHTPGHSPGHISLWRENDRTLIAGDAFTTTIQESASSAFSGEPKVVHGPPKYFTPDWAAAWQSVEKLAKLEPNVAATGHGWPMAGELLRNQLRELARDFPKLAMPEKGRYVGAAACFDEDGVKSVPPRVRDPLLIGAGVAAGVGALLLAGLVQKRIERQRVEKVCRRLRARSVRELIE